MASDTKNVKLGVCKVFFGGKDLGYTQGGVEVAVKTDTHKVNVDQFGKTTVNEYLMGREVTVKVPLAETTLDNMVLVMPGSTLVTDSVAAAGTVTVATQPANGQTAVINGKTFTFKTAPTLSTDVLIGANAAATAANWVSALNTIIDPLVSPANYSNVGAVITITYGTRGVVGNAFTIATGTAAGAVTVSAATLASGVDGTFARVETTSGIGIDLLAGAKELRLHPKSRVDSDKTEDFVIPLANTAGGLKFAYKLESERIYDCDFTGYPDPYSGKLFSIGT